MCNFLLAEAIPTATFYKYIDIFGIINLIMNYINYETFCYKGWGLSSVAKSRTAKGEVASSNPIDPQNLLLPSS